MPEHRKILHLIARLDGYGTTRQLRILAQEQLAEGHDVRIAALRSSPAIRESWEAEGLSPAVLERRWRYDPFAAWRLTELLKAERPDVLHAWDLGAASYAALARLRAGGVPLVATLLTPPAAAWALSQIDRLAVGSEALRREYAAHGLASDHLAVVPPAITPPAAPRMPRADFLAALDLPPTAQLIAIVGPLQRAKRFDEAIWCFELVRTLDERAALVIFGDGPDQQRLQRFTRLVSDPAAVKFLGYRDDLASLMNHLSVFWHLSEEPAISGALLESMASRVPVVSSDVPVHQGLIEHERTGFLAPVGSRAGLARHTLRLLEDEQLAQQIGSTASAEISRRFSTAAMTEAYRQLYDELLQPKIAAA